jgi:hypothetical protein
MDLSKTSKTKDLAAEKTAWGIPEEREKSALQKSASRNVVTDRVRRSCTDWGQCSGFVALWMSNPPPLTAGGLRRSAGALPCRAFFLAASLQSGSMGALSSHGWRVIATTLLICLNALIHILESG